MLFFVEMSCCGRLRLVMTVIKAAVQRRTLMEITSMSCLEVSQEPVLP